jgi:hypothetical protein
MEWRLAPLVVPESDASPDCASWARAIEATTGAGAIVAAAAAAEEEAAAAKAAAAAARNATPRAQARE